MSAGYEDVVINTVCGEKCPSDEVKRASRSSRRASSGKRRSRSFYFDLSSCFVPNRTWTKVALRYNFFTTTTKKTKKTLAYARAVASKNNQNHRVHLAAHFTKSAPTRNHRVSPSTSRKEFTRAPRPPSSPLRRRRRRRLLSRNFFFLFLLVILKAAGTLSSPAPPPQTHAHRAHHAARYDWCDMQPQSTAAHRRARAPLSCFLFHSPAPRPLRAHLSSRERLGLGLIVFSFRRPERSGGRWMGVVGSGRS